MKRRTEPIVCRECHCDLFVATGKFCRRQKTPPPSLMGTSVNQMKRKSITLICFRKSRLCKILFPIFLLFVIIVFSRSKKPSFLSEKKLYINSNFQCRGELDSSILSREKYLWFAPHSGFSNQVAELKNAILMGAILNRTVIVPPVLDHHAVSLGSCPKFRVENPRNLREAVWRNVVEMIQSRRYISIADIIDLSPLKSSSLIKTIDLRVFGELWCHTDMSLACTGDLCCSMSVARASPRSFEQCGSLLSALDKESIFCVFGVEEDCRTTVWTYQQNDTESLDSFQPSKELQTKKKISYVRKRRDVYKTLGPGSEADEATVLSFGSLFNAPYKGSELYIDINVVPKDIRIQSLIQQIEFLPFVPEIMSAGKSYAAEMIQHPFLCAQLRLLDGQFKNHWKPTFAALKNKIQMIKSQNGGSHAIHIFVMTDLPSANWAGTYLGDLADDQELYKLYNLHEGDELVIQTAKTVLAAEHGIRSGFFPEMIHQETNRNDHCPSTAMPDILLYIEESICSCASLGFVGTAGSTIAENIELIRKNNVCLHTNV